MQVIPAEAAAATDEVTDLGNIWTENLAVSRNIMAITHNLNRGDEGHLTAEEMSDLITPPHDEIAGSTAVVPESVLKNIPAFDPKPEKGDMDIALEHFLNQLYDAAKSNNLSYEGQKTLIIRKLSPKCLLLVNSELTHSDKKLPDLTLLELVGILETIYCPNSSPSAALLKLQDMGKIQNKNYLEHCAAITRLVRLTVRKEGDADTRKILLISRTTEFLIPSLHISSESS